MVAMGRALMSRPKLLLMDEPSMGLAPILVERNFEIIKQVHESGVAILVVEQNANVSLSIADRGYVLSTGRLVLEGKAADLRENDEPAEGLPWPLDGAASARCRSRFPIFERLTYINSCSQGALSDSVRAAYGDYLDGWDERGAPWEYWVERAETARATFARLVGAAPDDVAVTTSVSAGVSAFASGDRLRGAAEGRDQRLRVPDDRPDLARAGAARRRGRARPRRCGGDPVERFDEAIDERDGGRLDHRVCYRNGVAARRRGDRAGSRTSAARSSCSTPTRRSARTRSTWRELGVDVLAAGVLKYLLGSAGLGFMWTRPGSCEQLVPTADRLVRRPEHLRDGHHRLLAVADGAPLPVRHAAGARRSTPASPGIELMQEIGIAETRAHVTALNERLIGGVDELGGAVVTPRDPERRGALVCIRSTDAPQLVAALGADGHRHLGARREPAGLGARLQHRGRHRRGPRRAWRGTGTSSEPDCRRSREPGSRVCSRGRRGSDLRSAYLTFYKTY